MLLRESVELSKNGAVSSQPTSKLDEKQQELNAA